jgi:hypothetical protein
LRRSACKKARDITVSGVASDQREPISLRDVAA